MKHLRLFETEAAYTAATLDLPVISYVKATGAVHYDGRHAVDRSINAPLMNMCVAKGWAKESNNYLTYEEASLVTAITNQDLLDYEVTRLLELKYFTAVTAINIKNTLVESVYIRNNVTASYQGDNSAPEDRAIKYIKLADDLVSTWKSNNGNESKIDQYSFFKNKFTTAPKRRVIEGTYMIGGKNTTRFDTYYGGSVINVQHVVIKYEDSVLASSTGISIDYVGVIYVPDALVDGYKEAYPTYASKFVPLSTFDDPYPDY